MKFNEDDRAQRLIDVFPDGINIISKQIIGFV